MFTVVMKGSFGNEYRTPCRTLEEAEELRRNNEALGYDAYIEREAERFWKVSKTLGGFSDMVVRAMTSDEALKVARCFDERYDTTQVIDVRDSEGRSL